MLMITRCLYRALPLMGGLLSSIFAAGAWAADIGVNVQFNPAQVSVNTPATLIVKLQSTSPTGINAIGFNTALSQPTGLTISGVPANTCGGNLNASSNGSITLSGGALPAATVANPIQSCSITLNVSSARAC